MDKIIVGGVKESFLIMVLIKKLTDEGYEAEFVPWTVDAMNRKLDKTSLITIYMDTDERPSEAALGFMSDKLIDIGGKVISIGEDEDNRYIIDRMASDIIHKTFERPIDTGRYLESVREIFAGFSTKAKKKSILVVDDDPTYLMLVRDWLKSDYKVSMANSGLQAIKWLGMNSADLILLDYEMPVTTGAQVLEMLRSDTETSSIPVFFLTGKSDKQSVVSVLALKPEGYFIKSISKGELLEKIREFFEK